MERSAKKGAKRVQKRVQKRVETNQRADELLVGKRSPLIQHRIMKALFSLVVDY